MILSKVVLPQPDGPKSASRLPVGTSTLTRSRAENLPKRLLISLMWMLMGVPAFRTQMPIAVAASYSEGVDLQSPGLRTRNPGKIAGIAFPTPKGLHNCTTPSGLWSVTVSTQGCEYATLGFGVQPL